MNIKTLGLSLILSSAFVSTQVLAKGTIEVTEPNSYPITKRPKLTLPDRITQAEKRVKTPGSKFSKSVFGQLVQTDLKDKICEHVRSYPYNRDVQDWLLSLGGKELSEYGLEKEHSNLKCAYESFQKLRPRHWNDIEEVDFRSFSIAILPWEIFTANLKEFIITGSSLPNLPDDVQNWQELEKFSFVGTQFTRLPAGVKGWRSLQSICISNSPLASLPEEVSFWDKLSFASLTNNQFTTLPRGVRKWANLKRIFLRGNKITSLPSEVEEWRQLEEASLVFNNITTLPAGVSQWPIKSLYLTYNPFERVPIALGLCSNLTELYISPEQAKNWNIRCGPGVEHVQVSNLNLLKEKLREEYEEAEKSKSVPPLPQTLPEALTLIENLRKENAAMAEKIRLLEATKK